MSRTDSVVAMEDLSALTDWFSTSKNEEPHPLSIITGVMLAYHMGYRRALEDAIRHPRHSIRALDVLIDAVPDIKNIPPLDEDAGAEWLTGLFEF